LKRRERKGKRERERERDEYSIRGSKEDREMGRVSFS
jgi:hypothetical protein